MKNAGETYKLLIQISKNYRAKAGGFKRLKHVSESTLHDLFVFIWNDVQYVKGQEEKGIYTTKSLWSSFDTLLTNARSIQKMGYGNPPGFLEDLQKVGLVESNLETIVEFLEVGGRLHTYLTLVRFWAGEKITEDIKTSLGPTIIDLSKKIRSNLEE